MISIRNALETVSDLLHAHLKTVFSISEDLVVLTNIVELDGSLNGTAANKIVVQLYAVLVSNDARNLASPVGFSAAPSLASAQLPLDLQVMIMANFTGANYPEGLEMMSHVIAFLEHNPVITKAGAPGLAEGIDSLQLAWNNLGPADTQRVMDMLGTKYLPAMPCKIRVIPAAEPAGTPAGTV